MKDLHYPLLHGGSDGYCDVHCDGAGCNAEERIDGFDGHPPMYCDVSKNLQVIGWTVKSEGARRLDLCPSCSKNYKM